LTLGESAIDPVSPKIAEIRIESHRRAIRLDKAGLDDIPAVNVVAPVARRVVPGRPPKDQKAAGLRHGSADMTTRAAQVPLIVDCRCHHRDMSTPTVEAAINELMDWEWHAVEELLAKRGLLGDGLLVEDYTGLMSWLESVTRYTVVHSASVAVLFVNSFPVDAISFHRDLLGSDDPKSFFTLMPRT
jgi:hypothetical protein